MTQRRKGEGKGRGGEARGFYDSEVPGYETMLDGEPCISLFRLGYTWFKT